MATCDTFSAQKEREMTMSNMTFELDPTALREATVQAIMGVLTPETRERILQNAVSELLKPSINSWENKKSPLEQAFDRSVSSIAHEEARRMIGEDAVIRERIKALLRTTADKVLGADVDKLAERMADAFVSSMRKD